MRDLRHVDKFFFSLQSGLFYESIELFYEPLDIFKRIVETELRLGTQRWQIHRDGFWFNVYPAAKTLPLQGWKIHVSSVAGSAEAILQKVSRLIVADNTAFKFALDQNVLATMSSKGWHRGSSGKFITIYPDDREHFLRLIEKIYDLVRNEQGPYILSDQRYRNCRALYYRFGGIRSVYRMESTGTRTLVLQTPTGQHVPDVRLPYFAVPPWESDPFGVEEDEASAPAGEPSNTLRNYSITESLAFSNAGGVYLGEDSTSKVSVVIKEAREHVAVENGVDAIGRLRKEWEILNVLSDAKVAPRPIEFFEEWEHAYLVEEHLSGSNLREVLALQSPLLKAALTIADVTAFYHRFSAFCRSFLMAVQSVHSRGILFGDLSATNLIIDSETCAVRLIDFETAFRPNVDPATYIFTAEFKNPKVTGASASQEDDLFCVAAIMLYAIFPISALASSRDDVYESVLRAIVMDLGWSATPVFEALSGLATGRTSCAEALELFDQPALIVVPAYGESIDVVSWSKVTYAKLATFLASTFDYRSAERLVPADPFMYFTNPLGVGFGASGALYSLLRSGFSVPDCALSWVRARFASVKPDELPAGLLTGWSGVAWCFYEMGLIDEAIEALRRANVLALDSSEFSLFYGTAGVGMANLLFYRRTRSEEYLAASIRIGDALVSSAKSSSKGLWWERDTGVSIGFGYGQSGIALFLLRLAQTLGQSRFKESAEAALAFDLSHVLSLEPGVLSLPATPEDTTAVPYLEDGSAGVAKVALRMGNVAAFRSLLPDTRRKYSVFPGLLYGLAGFVDLYADGLRYTGDAGFEELMKRPLSGLRDLYVVEQAEGAAVPGDGLLKISCDYATGVSGVMRALHRAVHRGEGDFTLDEIDAVETITASGKLIQTERIGSSAA